MNSGEGVRAFSFHHLLCVYVDSTSSLTAWSIGAGYHSAGDQTGRIGRAGVHDHPRDFRPAGRRTSRAEWLSQSRV